MTSSQAAKNKKYWLQVVLDVPLRGPFDYWHEAPVATGNRVLVTFGRRKLVGIVTGMLEHPNYDPDKVRAIEQVLDDLPPLPPDWLAMAQFAARYYRRALGVAHLPAWPAPAL